MRSPLPIFFALLSSLHLLRPSKSATFTSRPGLGFGSTPCLPPFSSHYSSFSLSFSLPLTLSITLSCLIHIHAVVIVCRLPAGSITTLLARVRAIATCTDPQLCIYFSFSIFLILFSSLPPSREERPTPMQLPISSSDRHFKDFSDKLFLIRFGWPKYFYE